VPSSSIGSPLVRLFVCLFVCLFVFFFFVVFLTLLHLALDGGAPVAKKIRLDAGGVNSQQQRPAVARADSGESGGEDRTPPASTTASTASPAAMATPATPATPTTRPSGGVSAMASSTLQDELTCTCCLELLFEPVALMCGHTFCSVCITDWRVLNNTCPCCSKSILSEPCRVLVLENAIEELTKSLSVEVRLSLSLLATPHC